MSGFLLILLSQRLGRASAEPGSGGCTHQSFPVIAGRQFRVIRPTPGVRAVALLLFASGQCWISS